MWTRRSGNRFHFARIRFPTNHERSVRRKPTGQSTQTDCNHWNSHSCRAARRSSHCCRLGRSTRPWTDPGPTWGGLLVGLTTSKFIMNGSAYLSPIARRFKRSVSASLAGEVSMMSEGLAECEWIRGVLEPAVYRDCERRPCTDDVQFNFLPTVTVMKANSATHFDPSIVCVLSTPRVPLDLLSFAYSDGAYASLASQMSLGARQHDCGCRHEVAWQQRDHVEVPQEEHVEHLRRSQGIRPPTTVPARTRPKPANAPTARR